MGGVGGQEDNKAELSLDIHYRGNILHRISPGKKLKLKIKNIPEPPPP